MTEDRQLSSSSVFFLQYVKAAAPLTTSLNISNTGKPASFTVKADNSNHAELNPLCPSDTFIFFDLSVVRSSSRGSGYSPARKGAGAGP